MLTVFVTGCIVHQAISGKLTTLTPPSSANGQFLNRTLEYLKITGSEATYDASVKMLLDSFGSSLGSSKDKVKLFLTQCCSFSSLKYDLAGIYMQEFTLNDINQMIRFYSSPVGKKLTRKQSVLMAKAKELGERRVNEQLPKLQAMIQQEMSTGESI